MGERTAMHHCMRASSTLLAYELWRQLVRIASRKRVSPVAEMKIVVNVIRRGSTLGLADGEDASAGIAFLLPLNEPLGPSRPVRPVVFVQRVLPDANMPCERPRRGVQQEDEQCGNFDWTTRSASCPEDRDRTHEA